MLLNKKALLGMGSAFFINVYTDVYTALSEQTKKAPEQFWCFMGDKPLSTP
jgi:hypothetical protein